MVQQKEAKYVNEWLMINHPTALTWKRVRLGPIPKKGLGKLLRVTLRWVDAIFYENGIVHIVEAKLRRDVKVITQLVLARQLFRETPEFSQFWDKPIKLIALLPFDDPDIRSLAARERIQVEIYQPEWLMKELSK